MTSFFAICACGEPLVVVGAGKSQSRVVLAPVDVDIWHRELVGLSQQIGEAAPSATCSICATLKTALLLVRHFSTVPRKRLVLLCCSDIMEARGPLVEAATKLADGGVQLDIIHFGQPAPWATCGTLKEIMQASSPASSPARCGQEEPESHLPQPPRNLTRKRLPHQPPSPAYSTPRTCKPTCHCIVEQPLLGKDESSDGKYATADKLLEYKCTSIAKGVGQSIEEEDTQQKIQNCTWEEAAQIAQHATLDSLAALDFCRELPHNRGMLSILLWDTSYHGFC